MRVKSKRYKPKAQAATSSAWTVLKLSSLTPLRQLRKRNILIKYHFDTFENKIMLKKITVL